MGNFEPLVTAEGLVSESAILRQTERRMLAG
jgi:hypothetical protein